MDDKWSIPSRVMQDQRHFDDCEFDGSIDFIRDRYVNFDAWLAAAQPWYATDMFGRILHPAMDFYSHANWVEMLLPPEDDHEPGLADLVDFSGAQDSLSQQWKAPPNGGNVRDDIRLANDDWTLPFLEGPGAGWHKDAHPKAVRPGRRLPRALAGNGRRCRRQRMQHQLPRHLAPGIRRHHPR
jgi:hypothetical protein